MLYFEGDPIERVFLLTSGSVKITKLGRGGVEVILRLAARGDSLNAEGLIWCGKYCATAQVLRPCRALVWDARVFKDLVERFPVLHENLVAILSDHLRELEDRFREAATGRVGPRLALQLLRLLKTIGQPVHGGGGNRPFARRVGADDRYHTVCGEPAPFRLGRARSRQASP